MSLAILSGQDAGLTLEVSISESFQYNAVKTYQRDYNESGSILGRFACQNFVFLKIYMTSCIFIFISIFRVYQKLQCLVLKQTIRFSLTI